MVARSTLVLAAAFVLAGAAFDSPSLYVPGLALALLVAGSWLWVSLSARSVRVTRERGPFNIVEGESYPVDLRIQAGRLPLPGGRVVHPLADRSAPVGRQTRRVFLEVPALRRGRRHVGAAALRLSDPLGIHHAELGDGHGGEVLVLPRIEPVVWRGEAGAGAGSGDGIDGSALPRLDAKLLDLELDGFRRYRSGSPASRIHWPTFARIGEPLEHRLVDESGSSPVVVLDSSAPADEDALDRAVRAAASLCVHLARLRGCELLLCGERRALRIDEDLRTWPKLQARLATVKAGGPRPAVGRAQAGSGVLWVTAAAPAENAHAPLGPSLRYLVTPSPIPGIAPDFTVAGCHGHGALGARPSRRASAESARTAT